jgi:release factor glutamine methyltransferase
MNAARHGLAERIEFVHTSYLEGVPGPFDVIVANPPYVKDGARQALSRDVLHEPDVALFGGSDGLLHISAVMDTAVEKLVPGGWFLMEFGYGQEEDVRQLAAQRASLRVDHVRDDLQGIARTAVIQKAQR